MSVNSDNQGSQILPHSELSEEDIKRLYITPALEAKWEASLITMEYKITDGKINTKGNLTVREKPKKADYVLFANPQLPLAIVEAKSARCSISKVTATLARRRCSLKGLAASS